MNPLNIGTSKKIPKWWKKINRNPGLSNLSCQDHESYGDDKVYWEPYPQSMEGIKDLISFCEKNNLTFYIDGHSTWYPGRTFTIIIYPKEANE